jgi:hypothetical protein
MCLSGSLEKYMIVGVGVCIGLVQLGEEVSFCSYMLSVKQKKLQAVVHCYLDKHTHEHVISLKNPIYIRHVISRNKHKVQFQYHS